MTPYTKISFTVVGCLGDKNGIMEFEVVDGALNRTQGFLGHRENESVTDYITKSPKAPTAYGQRIKEFLLAVVNERPGQNSLGEEEVAVMFHSDLNDQPLEGDNPFYGRLMEVTVKPKVTKSGAIIGECKYIRSYTNAEALNMLGEEKLLQFFPEGTVNETYLV